MNISLQNKNLVKLLAMDPYVQCPEIPVVTKILQDLDVCRIHRGNKLAYKRLEYMESLFREHVKHIVDLTEFKHCYIVAGATDAIHQWLCTEQRPWQYLRGDYEYAHNISGQGSSVSKFNQQDVVYVSNPACSTGNIINIAHIDNPVILDCAYLGSTRKFQMPLPKNTEQIWFSFSKGWGLVGQRIGLVFTKQPHVSLSKTKAVGIWNYTSVETAIKMLENFSIDDIPNMLKPLQQEICEKLSMEPSDCFFIGTTNNPIFDLRKRSTDLPARINLAYCYKNML